MVQVDVPHQHIEVVRAADQVLVLVAELEGLDSLRVPLQFLVGRGKLPLVLV